MSWGVAMRSIRKMQQEAQAAFQPIDRLRGVPYRCERCGTPTEHKCSWVCVEMCPKCDVLK